METFLDRNHQLVSSGSRVTGFEGDAPIFQGIAVWSPHAGHEIVIERWMKKTEDPPTRVMVGGSRYTFELTARSRTSEEPPSTNRT